MGDEVDFSAAVASIAGFEQLADSLYDVVIRCEAIWADGRVVDFQVVYMNRAAFDTFRIDPAVVGLRVGQLLPQAARYPLHQALCRVVETGEPFEQHGIDYRDTAIDGPADGVVDVRAERFGNGHITVWRDWTRHRRIERELRDRQARTALLAELTALPLDGSEPESILEQAARRLAEVLGDSCFLLLPAHGRDDLHIRTFFGRTEEATANGRQLLIPGVLPITIHHLPDTAHVLSATDLDQVLLDMAPGLRELPGTADIRSVAALPLVAADCKLGALVLLRLQGSATFVDTDLEFGREVASRAALMMENARLNVEQQRADTRLRIHADRLAVLAEFSRAPETSEPEPLTLLDTVAQRLTDLLGDACLIALDEDEAEAEASLPPLLLHTRTEAIDEAIRAACAGLPSDWPWFAVTTETGPVVLHRGELSDLAPLMPESLRAFVIDHGVSAVVKLALTAGDRFLGVLTVFRSGVDQPGYQPDDVEFLTEVASRVSLVVENANLRVSRERAMGRLAASEQRFRLSFDNAPNGIAVVSVDQDDVGRILEVNEAFANLVGHPRSEATDLTYQSFIHPEDRVSPNPEAFEMIGGTRRHWAEDMRFVRRDGEIIWVRTNASLMPDLVDGTKAMIVTVEDITARKGAEAAMAHRAMHDALTGLPNRHLLMDRLTVALEGAHRSGDTVALLYIDLDRFKEVNDSLGHEAGDLLLKEVASRLADTVRAPDTASRLAGDEFVVVCPKITDQAQAEGIARRLLDALDRPMTIGRHQVTPAASIGIAITTGGRIEPDDLLRWADTALYRAKQAGRHCAVTYSPSAEYHVPSRQQGERDLRLALTEDRLALHYQPMVDLATGRPVGVEALLRIAHPTRGLLLPDDLVTTIDDRELALEVTRWVLAQSGRQVRDWRETIPDLELSVNLGSRLVTDGLAAAVVADAFEQTGLVPDAWWFEVAGPELDTADVVPSVLRGLRDLGAHVSIDDYGGPGPSLVRLGDLPVDAIKIDRRLIQSMTAQLHSQDIVGTIVALAAAVGARAVAVGVETGEQEAALKRLGCGYAQGCRYLAPVAADSIDRWLAPQLGRLA